jgi:hypothetical protein
MKFSAIALALYVVLAGPAAAAPGDPRLIQGVLEWPPTLAGGEPFIVVRGDDGHVYYADVMAAQRHVRATVSAGSHIALLGLESTKPHEIVAVALGSGDAAALSLALAQGTPTTPTPPPPASTASAAVVPPAPPAPPVAPAAVAPARPEEKPSARGEVGQWVKFRGSVYGVAGRNLYVKRDDGQVVMVDVSKLDPGTVTRYRPGSLVTVVAFPVGNKFLATSIAETDTGTTGSTPAR